MPGNVYIYYIICQGMYISFKCQGMYIPIKCHVMYISIKCLEMYISIKCQEMYIYLLYNMPGNVYIYLNARKSIYLLKF